MPTLGGDATAQDGMDDNNVLFKTVGEGNDTLHADNDSGEHSAGNGGILAVGKGDDALPVDDNSSALRVNDDIGDGDATVPIILHDQRWQQP
jgi:hypothetical protein